MEQKTQNRTERKKEETQNRVITVAVDLFNQHGLESVTMEQIAGAVDIAKGTLYNYFPSKEAIINAYLQQTFQEHNDERVEKLRRLPDTRSRLVAVFSFLIEGVKRQKQIFEAFMVYRMKQVISFHPVEEGEQTGLSLLVREIIELGQRNHELRADLPAHLLEDFFEFALIEVIKPFYLQPENFDQDKVIEQSVDLFLSGAKA
ncbi:MAG: TetR/AcrR family transcriptional regulator [Anaerolineaceae bacterium]|nr:TetR/AcrR family transcriptional regulator [Anaerolineaceae bacterium]